MKAVKINKIIWNLNDLTPAERGKAKASLPTSKGFVADDDFNVPDKVPDLLEKKYGYPIINFSYTEIHIVDTFEKLLKIFKAKDEKRTRLFDTKGELSELGQECYDKLLDTISKRKEMEEAGTPDDEMPKLLDKVMLSLEKVTGMPWGDNSAEEYKEELDNILQDKIEEYLKSAEAKKLMRKEVKKSLKDEMKKMEEEDEDERDDDDDDDDDNDDKEEE